MNGIAEIENVNHLTNLVSLNLSDNRLKKVEGLEGLIHLQNLDLSGNSLATIDDCGDLTKLPSLSHLSLQKNNIGDHEHLFTFFGEIQTLHALFLLGNPCCAQASHYRKNLVARLKALSNLDDRPVFEVDHKFAEAWLAGGAEAEAKAR